MVSSLIFICKHNASCIQPFNLTHYRLSNWFNATTNIERQAKVEAWIREHYPEVWTEIEKVGYWVTMEGFGYRQYNINRNLDP